MRRKKARRIKKPDEEESEVEEDDTPKISNALIIGDISLQSSKSSLKTLQNTAISVLKNRTISRYLNNGFQRKKFFGSSSALGIG